MLHYNSTTDTKVQRFHLCCIAHKTRKKNFEHFSLNVIETGVLVKNIPKQGVAQYSHRSACVLPTEAPGRHSTQTRTQASPPVAESEAKLRIGFLLVDEFRAHGR